jgi:hypothetical protein
MNASVKVVDVLLEICTQAGVDKSIDPIEAAATYAQACGRGLPYQSYLPAVRDAAVELAKQGKLVIYRKGVVVDPETFKGVYRIGLAPQG